jgi:hypothetical protein
MLVVVPVTTLIATIGNLQTWKQAGYFTSKTVRYSAYFLEFWINLAIWSLGLFEVILGCDIPLLRVILFLPLIPVGLVLGLTNYIPRHPPFSLRRKIFVLTTFTLSITLLWIPLPQFMEPSARRWILFCCIYLFIESITRSAEALVELARKQWL